MSLTPRSLALLHAALLLVACGVPDSGPAGQAPQATSAAAEVGLPSREPAVAPSMPSYPGPAVTPTAAPPPPATGRSQGEPSSLPWMVGGYPPPGYPAPLRDPRPASTYTPATVDLGLRLADSAGDVQITSDGRYAVYLSDDEGDQLYDLYSARIDGSATVRLYARSNPTGQPRQASSPISFVITPDNSMVVFVVPDDGMYRVPIDGAQATRIGPPAAEFRISPDSAWVVSQDVQQAIFSQPLAGGERVQLGKALPMINMYDIATDSRTVVLGQRNESGSVELHSVPIGGGARTCLSCEQGIGRFTGAFRLTPDGRSVVYVYSSYTDGLSSLAAAPLAGGAPISLWKATPDGQTIWWISLSPDGATAVFTVTSPNTHRIFAAPVTGRPVVQLGDSQAIRPGFGDGSVVAGYVVYTATQAGDAGPELYSATLDGGQAVRLSGPRPFAGQIRSWQVATANGRVVFATDLEQQGVVRLYGVDVAGGQPTALSGPLPANQSWVALQITPDGTSAVYGVGTESREYIVRYSSLSVVRVDGQGERLIADGGGIKGFFLTPDSQRALILADHNSDGEDELYVVRLWE